MTRLARHFPALLLVVAIANPRWVRAAEPAEAEAETAPAAAAPAQAEPPPASNENEMKGKAMEAYHRGEAAYRAEQWSEALAAFQEASSFYASPDFQYNIGRCYENLGSYEDAVRSYEIYLRAKPNAPDSGAIRERIGRLRGLIEAQQAEEERRKNEEPRTVVIEKEADKAPPPPGRPFVIAGSVLTGVGLGLALGGGIGFGVVAGNRSDQLDEIQTGGNPNGATMADAQAIEDEGRQAELGQIATAAGGGAVAVAGIALLAVGLIKNKNARASGTARIVPTLNRSSAGLVLTGRF
jgi:tetratricopeptide (TPR) repeat protein